MQIYKILCKKPYRKGGNSLQIQLITSYLFLKTQDFIKFVINYYRTTF